MIKRQFNAHSVFYYNTRSVATNSAVLTAANASTTFASVSGL